MWWDSKSVTVVQRSTVLLTVLPLGNTIHVAIKIAVLTMSESSNMSKAILFRYVTANHPYFSL